MEFPADIEFLPQMLEFVRGILSKNGMSKQAARDIELCCEEAIVNIIMHGEAKGSIQLECSGDAQNFFVTIRDGGPAFNPSLVEIDPRIDRPIDERKVGGLGIYLMRKLAQEISYKRIGETNVLTMGFRL